MLKKKTLILFLSTFIIFVILKFIEKYYDDCVDTSNDWVYNNKNGYNDWMNIYQDGDTLDTLKRLMKKGPIYIDQYKALHGDTYPICKNNTLISLDNILVKEEQNRNDYEGHYNKLLNKGRLHCGRIRVGSIYDNIFGKKHYIPWTDCIPGILPAKRRLLDYITQLCDHQQQIVNIGNNMNKQQLVDRYMNKPIKRGILYTGKASHLKNIFQSIKSHRMLNVSLPIEVWVIKFDLMKCLKTVGQLPLVHCYTLPNHVRKFASKYHALLSTKLTDVMFMDVDNLAVRDVNIIFESEGYKRDGMVLWPDLWGDRCRAIAAHFPDGYSAYKTHVLWMAGFGGLTWNKERVIAQEAEAGQVAIDVRRHGGLLEVGRQFIEDKFLAQVVNGDKDIFRLVNLIFQEPFYFVPHIPGYSVNKAGMRDCLVHYFKSGDLDYDGTLETEPIFFHQLKIRDPDAMKLVYRLPMNSRTAYSTCAELRVVNNDLNNVEITNTSSWSLDEQDSSILPPLIPEIPKKSEEYYKFAVSLYDDVDKEWNKIKYANYWLFFWAYWIQLFRLNKIILPCVG